MQRYASHAHVLVRGSGGTDAVRAIGQEVRAIDPNLPLVAVRPLRKMILALMPQRVLATVMAGFGLFALLLAAVGTYGIVAYNVAQRTTEIATRMALGASHRQILLFVLRHALGLFARGLTIGLVLTLFFGRFLRALTLGRGPVDPAVFFGVALLLTLVTLLATAVPAWRAVRIRPMNLLRAG